MGHAPAAADALVPGVMTAVVDVEMAHAAAIDAEPAFVVGPQPGDHGGTLASRRMEIDRAAGGVKAAPAGAGDDRAAAKG